MTALNNYNRDVLKENMNYVNLILARILVRGINVTGPTIKQTVLRGDRENITEFPDQRMFDELGFTIIINPTDGPQYSLREIVSHLTGNDYEAYDNIDDQSFINQVFLETFPYMR